MQQAIEHVGRRGPVTQQFAQSSTGQFEVIIVLACS